MADIIAIGLQELCWNCNPDSLHKVAEAFESRLRAHRHGKIILLLKSLARDSIPCYVGRLELVGLSFVGYRDSFRSFSAKFRNYHFLIVFLLCHRN